jgi:hypothetical protein
MENNAFTVPQIAGVGQVVAYTGTAGTIANFLPAGTQKIWIFCTSIAHVKISAAGTAATTADFPVPASVPVIFEVDSSKGPYKVSAIQSAAGGNLHVAPLNYD